MKLFFFAIKHKAFFQAIFQQHLEGFQKLLKKVWNRISIFLGKMERRRGLAEGRGPQQGREESHRERQGNKTKEGNKINRGWKYGKCLDRTKDKGKGVLHAFLMDIVLRYST